MLTVEGFLSALPSDRLIKSDDTVELFDLVDADTSHSFERCHINVAVGCDDILQDRQLNSDLEEQPTLAVIALSYDVLERRRDDVGDDVGAILQRMKLGVVVNCLADIVTYTLATSFLVVFLCHLMGGLSHINTYPFDGFLEHLVEIFGIVHLCNLPHFLEWNTSMEYQNPRKTADFSQNGVQKVNFSHTQAILEYLYGNRASLESSRNLRFSRKFGRLCRPM